MRGLAFIIFLAFCALVLYFGWIHFIGKSMKTAPETNSTKSEALQLKQKKMIEESRERQRQLMLERESRIRDIQRK